MKLFNSLLLMAISGMFSLDLRENSDTDNVDSVSRHIEQCCLAFLKSLVDISKNPRGYVILSSPRFCISLSFGNNYYNLNYWMRKSPINGNEVITLARNNCQTDTDSGL